MSARSAIGWELGPFVLLAWASVQSPGCSEPTGIANSSSSELADAGRAGDASVAGPTGDALPMGAVSLFNRRSCPSGWEPLASAAGRTLVPTVGDQPPGVTSGKPLDDGEDRQHSHAMPVALNVPSVNYVGIVGESNHGVARAGSIAMTVTGNKASAGLPYVQLLVCQKQVPPDLSQRPAPVGTLMFFQAAGCPTGWSQAGSTQGRILIGLPAIGSPGQKFGAAALTGTDKRTHHHSFDGAITTDNHGIALASGCCASGYGKDGRHPYDATTDAAEADLPYLQLLQCQKL